MRSNTVRVPSTLALVSEVPALFEIGDDPLDGAFGDPDAISEISDARLWVGRDAKEHVGVVRQEGPRRLSRVGRGVGAALHDAPCTHR